jgi:hypothetical protein
MSEVQAPRLCLSRQGKPPSSDIIDTSVHDLHAVQAQVLQHSYAVDCIAVPEAPGCCLLHLAMLVAAGRGVGRNSFRAVACTRPSAALRAVLQHNLCSAHMQCNQAMSPACTASICLACVRLALVKRSFN